MTKLDDDLDELGEGAEEATVKVVVSATKMGAKVLIESIAHFDCSLLG